MSRSSILALSSALLALTLGVNPAMALGTSAPATHAQATGTKTTDAAPAGGTEEKGHKKHGKKKGHKKHGKKKGDAGTTDKAAGK